MRFLHTSDWHLGRRFHGDDLIPAQRDFLDHLLSQARDHNVDAVLVAGDVYDRAIPSLGAVRLFNHALHQFAGLGIPVVMISGNHDSAHRLGVGSGLLARAGVHLRTDAATCATPVLLHDDHGPIAVYGLPYLEPYLVRAELHAEAASHQAVIAAALDLVRADLATRPPGTRSVVIAHAFVTGATSCESERDITIGGAQDIPAQLFDGIDYAALGHLHGAQRVSDRVHYSGSPLAYSFSEISHVKSVSLVDLDADANVTVTRVPCPVPRRLARLSGPLEDLLTNPDHDPVRDAWLTVELTDPALPYEPMARLRRRFPYTRQLKHTPAAIPAQRATSYRERVHGRSDLDITTDFLTDMRGTPPDAAERSLVRQAIDAYRTHAAETEKELS